MKIISFYFGSTFDFHEVKIERWKGGVIGACAIVRSSPT
jgi:hypothetical protein